MWYIVSTGIGFSLLTTNLFSRTIDLTLDGLGNIYQYMKNNENMLIREYYDDLESFDIQFKLQFVNDWLNNNKDKVKTNPNIEMLYNGISSNCNKISNTIETINLKIGEHKLKWFHSWRTLCLDEEIESLRKTSNILNERIKLIVLI
jgi:hypothetical protein